LLTKFQESRSGSAEVGSRKCSQSRCRRPRMEQRRKIEC